MEVLERSLIEIVRAATRLVSISNLGLRRAYSDSVMVSRWFGRFMTNSLPRFARCNAKRFI